MVVVPERSLVAGLEMDLVREKKEAMVGGAEREETENNDRESGDVISASRAMLVQLAAARGQKCRAAQEIRQGR